MREIKFRVWNSETRDMVDLAKITPLALDAGMNTQLAMQGASGLFIPFIHGMEIMQYTGLKDKNGAEIYEGDIVELEREMHHFMDGRWPIVYRNGAFTVGEAGMYFWDYASEGSDATLAVIGNVHENPELLETK